MGWSSYLEILLLILLPLRTGGHFLRQPQSRYLIRCILEDIVIVGSMNAGD